MNGVSASKLDHPNTYTPKTTIRQILSLHKLPYKCVALLWIFIRILPPCGKKAKLVPVIQGL